MSDDQTIAKDGHAEADMQTRDARWVHAAITTISFPRELEGFFDTVCGGTPEEWKTNLERLVDEDTADGSTNWSAPIWGLTGDPIFFYYAITSPQRIIRVRHKLNRDVEEVHQAGDHYSIVETDENGTQTVLLEDAEDVLRQVLNREAILANRYAGSIFACGRIVQPTEYFAHHSLHYKGRGFANIDNLQIFTNPLPYNRLRDAVKIGQGTITNLYGSDYTTVLRMLAEDNQLPDYLNIISSVANRLPQVDEQSWPVLAGDIAVRFAHESQLRVYLVDYLLDELSDADMPVFQECICFHNNIKTGIADYFICIGGTWIPVEVKLNIAMERDLPTQLKKYSGTQLFTPTKGRRRDKQVAGSGVAACLVLDQKGVYTTVDGQFFDCSAENPRWHRQKLDHESIRVIRTELITWISSANT